MVMAVMTLCTPGEPTVLLPIREGDTLDATLSRCGFARPRRGCRRGGCGQCLAHVTAGHVVDQRPIATTVLAPEQRAAGGVLLCRAVATTDVTVVVTEGQVRCVSSVLKALADRELDRRHIVQVKESVNATEHKEGS